MRFDKKDLLLYAVTDRSWLGGRTLYQDVEAAIKGGATFIQLREKNLDEAHFLEEAKEIKELCKKYQVPFVINDNVDIALAMDADGVHVGQSDLPAKEVRRILGPDKILGVSAARLPEAVKAVEDGADYLGVGAMYPTGTKTDARPVTMEELKEIRSAVNVPIVVIGGINLNTLDNFKNTGIDGLAVVSAVIGAKDIKKAAEAMAGRFREK